MEKIKIMDILKNNQFTKADIQEFIRPLYPVRVELGNLTPPVNRQQYERWNSGRGGQHQRPASNLRSYSFPSQHPAIYPRNNRVSQQRPTDLRIFPNIPSFLEHGLQINKPTK
ncbi:hypothetical protein TNCT_128591 [Trichonephila clavata]|uniref:Uncharacterized protein n=1 Tax=Trichonephila clavata TaxID=2740835 RepID=A0A8X6IB40_TRICU|nr:hypothetical protein TNCT_345821 [Trichonephila clavata]GFR01470.1 hypothetical protein TNCT_128591 [Trichonephila clavata]